MIPPPAFSLPARNWRLAALLALFCATQISDALAQDFFSDLFGGGWGGRRRSYDERDYDSWGERRVRRMAPHAQPQRRNAPITTPATIEAQKAGVKEKDPAAFRVIVLGDAFSQLLAAGLDQSFANEPKLAVLRRGNENSGLVRADYYDWMKAAREVAEDPKKPDMAVIMIGGNDRQALGEDAKAHEPLSPRWREIYGGRVEAMIQILREKDIPVVWVGLPVMQPTGYSAAIAQINEIFRVSAAKAGVPFVDLWDKFTDEHGQYSAFGPDENGQIVKLRSADGIHFTEAGARKLALFVEGEIKRLYEAHQANAPEPQKPATEAPASAKEQVKDSAKEAVAPVTFRPPADAPVSAPKAPTLPADRADVGQLQQLTSGAAPKSDDLAKKDPKPKTPRDASIEGAVAAHVFVKGGSQPSRSGRADDFAYRPAAAPAPASQ